MGKTSACSFHVWGGLGAIASLAAVLALTSARSLSAGVALIGWVLAIIVFLGVALVTKLITGAEALVYYRVEAAIVVVLWATLRWLGQPVLAYLDIAAVGLAAFLMFGRLGCFAVGCCHGKPADCGVPYGDEHARAGFPKHLVGVRLLPVQLMEAAWVGGATCASVARFLLGPAGALFAAQILAYAVGRFFLEFFRGDDARPHWAALSEAQWWSVLAGLAVCAGIGSGALPPVVARGAVPIVVLAILVVLGGAIRRLSKPGRRLVAPAHVAELARGLDVLADALARPAGHEGQHVRLVETSLGVRISHGREPGSAEWACHYTLSSRLGPLPADAARALAALILKLRHAGAHYELRPARGVVHVLVRAPADAASPES